MPMLYWPGLALLRAWGMVGNRYNYDWHLHQNHREDAITKRWIVDWADEKKRKRMAAYSNIPHL